MESRKTLAPSVRGEPAGLSVARALSPAPSSRFSLRRVSLSSSRTSTTCGSTCGSPSPVLTEDSSCVARETSLGDCARYRFITWAAVKRNSCERMTPSERLECPLLRCRQRFGDHEAMLRHLAACDHLGTCEYWCYEHMRVERFDDAKCSRRCLGQHSSKRRKMLVLAKTFFSTLGHKGRRGGDCETVAESDFGEDDDPFVFGVPSRKGDFHDIDPTAGVELFGNEILEIDSTEVVSPPQASQQPPAPSVPSAAAKKYVAPAVVDPQVLRLPELDSSEGMVDDSFMQWQPADVTTGCEPGGSSAFLDPSAGWLDAGGVSPLGSPAQRPPLQVNTYGMPQNRKVARPRPNPAPITSRSKDLSPSSSVRSTTSTTSTTSTVSNTSTTSAMSNVSSLISPASIWSHDSNMWSGFATHLTSPGEDLISLDGFLPGDTAYQDTAATFLNNTCPPPEQLHSVFYELPASIPEAKAVPEDMSSDQALFAHNAAVYSEAHDHSFATHLVLAKEERLEEMLELPQMSIPSSASSSPCSLPRTAAAVETHLSQPVAAADSTPMAAQSDTRTLVTSAWDALLEHIASSLVKIQHVTNNPLADQLRSLTPRLIATSGLNALRELLDGHPPTSPLDTICLTHVIYALSVIVYYKDDVAARCSQLYVQSLVCSTAFSEESKPFYDQLAAAIWHPADLSRTDLSQGLLRQYASIKRTPSQKGKERSEDLYRHIPYQEDPLICTARNFLDDLECCVILGSPSESLEVITSGLYTAHLQESAGKTGPNIALTAITRAVFTHLAKKFSGFESFTSRLEEISLRIASGSISTVRRVELELLKAGKASLPSNVYYDKFTSALGHICDRLYQTHGGGASQRTTYHRHGIDLFDAMISELESSRTAAALLQQSPIIDDSLLLDDFLTSITPSMANGSADGMLLPFDLDPETIGFPDLSAALQPPQAVGEAPGASSKMRQVKPVTGKRSQDYVQQPSALESTTAASSSSSSSSTTSPSPPHSDAAPAASSSLARAEANDCCEICGYRPKGDPQWFKGSMAKHRKLQHSAAPPKIYKCPFPGCTSQYKNRPDNLRQHQIEKGHFVDGEEPNRRPSKRKKLSE